MIILFWIIWVILIVASFVALRSMLLQEKQHSQREAKLNAQILELKKQLQESQETLKRDNLNKANLETKLSELKGQIEKLNKDLSANMQMYNGLKNQYDELERDMEKLQQELDNKDTALKTEQMAHQEIKEKYESLLKTTYGSKDEKAGGAISG